MIRINGGDYTIQAEANLWGADLSDADLSGADLSNLEAEDSNFTRVDLTGANLRGANLEEVNFTGANLSNADLTDADLEGAIYTDVIFSNVTTNNQVLLNMIEIQKIQSQLALLADALAAKDAEIEEKNERIAQLEEVGAEEVGALLIQEKDEQIAEKDAKIAELEQGGEGQSLEQVLEQVRDARAGSVVLTVEPDGNNITLGLTIEQSDNLIEWTKLDGEMTRTVPIPEGKKFYRFALDK